MIFNYYSFTFVILCLFLCCQNIEFNNKPDNLIDEVLMEQVLYEATLIEVMKTFSDKNPKFIKTLGTPYFFIKYGIDSLQLAKSEEYYTKNPRKYQKIYMKVLLRMEKHKDSFNLLSKIKKED
tara:strand:+ start:196 stop:564 length:369 start_codon:yes stop_codon:yes gene_type:complete